MAYHTPNPRGFPRVSSCETVAENCQTFGFQFRRRDWSFDTELDTRPSAVRYRKKHPEVTEVISRSKLRGKVITYVA